MKKSIALILFCAAHLFVMAQPVSGFMGKRFYSSLQFEVQPERNIYWESSAVGELALVPRFVLNTEYQMWRKSALSVQIGYTNPSVPYTYEYNHNTAAYYTETGAYKVPALTILLGVKKGIGFNMPLSGSYVAYRVGISKIRMDAFTLHQTNYFDWSSPPSYTDDEIEAINATSFVANLEIGKRYVFNNGTALEIGFGINFMSKLFTNIGDSEPGERYRLTILEKPYTYDDITQVEVELLAQQRVALNSLFVFKIGYGLFY
jgi:hypothetical protein